VNIRLHVDEITAWTWIAGVMFALLCLTSLLLGKSDIIRTTGTELVPPIVLPMLMPPEIGGFQRRS
jgi:hypothetical protein